jgi:hypothetical protein
MKPNQMVLQQTGHARSGFASFGAPSRVSRLLRWGVRSKARAVGKPLEKPPGIGEEEVAPASPIGLSGGLSVEPRKP